jgi:hypothetical protein
LFLIASLLATSDRPLEVVGVVAIEPAPGPTVKLVEMTTRLQSELASRTEGVLSPRELAERMSGTQPTASLSELDRAYAGAVEAGRTDPERGMGWLRDILTELEKQPDGAETFQQWTRANLRLARMRLEYVRSADEASTATTEARTILERVLRANPALTLDPDLYPKRMIALASDIRKVLAGSVAHTLTIASNESETEVFIDGRPLGKAPVTVSVPQGAYRVTGLSGVVRTMPTLVNLAEPMRVELDVLLPAAYRPSQGPGLALAPNEEEAKVIAAASALGVDRLVTTALVDRQGAIFLVASVIQVKPLATPLRQGSVRIGANGVPQGGYAALAEFLLTGRSHSGLVTPLPNPPIPTPIPPAPSPLARKLPKWTPIAAGALAVGMGVVTAVQVNSAAHDYGEARDMVAPNGALKAGSDPLQFEQLRAQGDSARGTATATGIAGGVLLGVTAALAYFAF